MDFFLLSTRRHIIKIIWCYSYVIILIKLEWIGRNGRSAGEIDEEDGYRQYTNVRRYVSIRRQLWSKDSRPPTRNDDSIQWSEAIFSLSGMNYWIMEIFYVSSDFRKNKSDQIFIIFFFWIARDKYQHCSIWINTNIVYATECYMKAQDPITYLLAINVCTGKWTRNVHSPLDGANS